VISGLHHYALEVPDLAVAEGFLQDFGPGDSGEGTGSLVAQCPGRDQEQVRLLQGGRQAAATMSRFTLRPGASLDPGTGGAGGAPARPVIEPPAGATEHGLWVRDP